MGWRHVIGHLGALLSLVGFISGCTSDDGVSCGPGTVEVGGTCYAEAEGATPTGPTDVPRTAGDGGVSSSRGDRDAGTRSTGGGPPRGGGTDAGWGTSPPGYEPPPGCDEAGGECDAWEEEILAGVRARQMAAGCAVLPVGDPRVDAVAERHAAYQASIDRLDATSPDGNLFRQVEDQGVRFTEAGAAFSVTRDGAADVLGRWDASRDTAPLLRRCSDLLGIGFHTSATEASYVTVLLIRE